MAFGKAYVNMADSAAENGASCCACSFAILLIILADIALAMSVVLSGLWAILTVPVHFYPGTAGDDYTDSGQE